MLVDATILRELDASYGTSLDGLMVEATLAAAAVAIRQRTLRPKNIFCSRDGNVIYCITLEWDVKRRRARCRKVLVAIGSRCIAVSNYKVPALEAQWEDPNMIDMVVEMVHQDAVGSAASLIYGK